MSSPHDKGIEAPDSGNVTPALDASRFQKSGYASLVSEMLTRMIVQGELHTGERLNEVLLAEKLQISRSPIREALKMLSGQGLVRMVPGRGAFVQSYDADVLRELGELREIIECKATELACERITPEELRAAEEEMEKVRLAIYGEELPNQHGGLSTDFHRIIAKACHNSEIASLIETIETKVMIARYRSGASSTRARRAHEEHAEILDAIRRRDAAGAVESMKTHLDASLENMIKTLNEELPATV